MLNSSSVHIKFSFSSHNDICNSCSKAKGNSKFSLHDTIFKACFDLAHTNAVMSLDSLGMGIRMASHSLMATVITLACIFSMLMVMFFISFKNFTTAENKFSMI